MLSAMISDDQNGLPRATEQDGTYPRPQLVRRRWADLAGEWGFAFDDDGVGLAERWYAAPQFDRTIVVPFPPESPASGVNDTSHHSVFWYHRTFDRALVEATGFDSGQRLILRFGAVDYRATVWVNGENVGQHEGGQTPFAVDVTDVLRADGANDIVLRVEDDPHDISQPRGKQDWRETPHVIWYHRTSGIWQPVWLESVPAVAIDWIHWTSDLTKGEVRARVGLTGAPAVPTNLEVELTYEGRTLGWASVRATGSEIDVLIPVTGQSNGQAYEELLWSVDHPRLIDARLTLAAGSGEADVVASYLGLRSTAVERGVFLLNDRPLYVRSVLEQGYWPESHLTAPSAKALRDEVELIKELGFNAARVHQKFEDPRFLFWADRLGLMLWGESPASFTFNATSVSRLIREWLEVVHRDYSHPSIVTWVPLNESWGVQHIAHNAQMQHYARSLVDLTKALDPTRPVVSNDGWEQVDTDILAIHDYEGDAEVIRHRYRDRGAIQELIDGVGPAGRRLVISGDVSTAPVMLTEFGGISFDAEQITDAWGYTAVSSADEFRERLTSLMDAVGASRVLAGYCYTQLTDTLQETNGLVTPDRVPKLPAEVIRAIMTRPSLHL